MSDQPEQNGPSNTPPPTQPGGWFQPENAVNKPLPSPASENIPAPDDAEPGRTGAWYVPPEAANRVAELNAQAIISGSTPADPLSGPTVSAAPTIQPPLQTMGLPPEVVQQAVVGHPIGAANAALESTVVPDNTSVIGQPAPEPALQQAPLPEGAAFSDEVDYSNYIPGVGFAKKAPAGAEPQVQQPIHTPAQQPVAVEYAAPAQPNQPQVNEPAPPPDEPLIDLNSLTAQPAQVITPPVEPYPAQMVAPTIQQPAIQQPALGSPANAVPASARPEVNQALVQKFLDVERSVQILRRRYTAGALSRDQLQSELRKLMILDEQGHWWMIGLETDRWYKYNGKDWVGTPPPGQTSDSAELPAAPARPVISTPAASPVANDSPLGRLRMTPAIPDPNAAVALDEYGMPLPQRVPVEDPGATVVNPIAPRLEQTLRSAPATIISSGGRGEQATVITDPAGYSSDATVINPAYGNNAAQVTQIGAAGAAGDIIPSPTGSDQIVSSRLNPIAQPDYGPKPEGLVVDRHRTAGCLIRAALVSLFLVLIVSLVAIVGSLLYYNSVISKYDPAIGNLAQVINQQSQSVRIFDASGRLLQQLDDPNFGKRLEVPLDQISPFMIQATIATENKTFYDDPGFDVVAIVRAVLQNITAGDTVSGASTITQQLTRAKILEPNAASDRTATRKITEIFVSSEVARRYTKSQILEYYLNTVYYGNLAYGVEAASQTYFGHSAKTLNVAESAFLAGEVQGPALYDPANNKAAAIARAQTVEDLMAKLGCLQMPQLPPDQAKVCVTPDLIAGAQNRLDTSVVTRTIANFKPTAAQTIYPHFVNYVKQQLEQQFGQDALYNSGFNVYTTIDPHTQDLAQAAVTQQISNLSRQHVTNGAAFAIRPTDGAILAMVGSADFNNAAIQGQFNVVLAPRQPGSSIKPFVYLGAFEKADNGSYWTPATVIWDVPTDFNGYKPNNYDHAFHGPQTVRYALANSYNIPAVKTLQYVGIDRFKKVAQRLGVNFPLTQPETAGLGSALGGVEVSLFDMVHGYSAFANGGKQATPYAITKVTRRQNGAEVTVFEPKPETGQQVIQPELAYLITNILSDNTARTPAFGANSALNLPGITAAVKTGTTNDSKDNWTIGYTPNLVVGVWVGNNDDSAMIGTSGVTGAAPIWNQIMTGLLSGQPTGFPQLPALTQATICADFGTLDFPDCKNRRQEIFFTAEPPPAGNTVFSRLKVDAFTNLVANQFCPDFTQDKTFLNITDQSALTWLSGDPGAQAFLQQYGLKPPILPAPTAACDANSPRTILKIANLTMGAEVHGLLQVMGRVDQTPNFANFDHYQIDVAPGVNGTEFTLADGPFNQSAPIENAFLGRWDTTKVADGFYTLRLAAFTKDGNSGAVTVVVRVNNTLPSSTIPQPVPGQPTLALPILPQPTFPGFPPTATPPFFIPAPGAGGTPTSFSPFPPVGG